MSRTGIAFLAVALVLGLAVGSSAQTINSTVTLSAGWNLMSFPTVPVNPAPATVFTGINPGVGGLSGSLVKIENGVTKTWTTLTASTWGNILSGEAYWVNNKQGSPFNVNYVAVDVSGDHWISLPNASWQLIGYPNLTPTSVLTDNCGVTDGKITRSLKDAMSISSPNGPQWIGNRLWRVVAGVNKAVGVSGSLGTEKSLYQNYGYWIETKVPNLALIIPASGTVP